MEPVKCYICNKRIEADTGYRLSTRTKYSQTILHDLLQSFLEEKLFLGFTAYDRICDECLKRLNSYDLANQIANNIQREVVNAFFATEYELLNDEPVYSEEPKADDNHLNLDDDFEILRKDYESRDEVLVDVVDININNDITDEDAPETSHSKGRLECELCNERFSSQYDLKRHRIRYHIAKKCGICQKVFENQIELRSHARDVHELDVPSEEIRQDESEITDADVTGEVLYRCLLCGIIETSADALQQHEANHENTLKCTVCGVVVKHKANLILHMRIHADKKFYKCDQCDKTFVHKSSLRMHLQTTHTDVKTKECPQCTMKFKTTSQLNQHLVIHSGVKKHECPVCGKAFSQKYNMTAHHRATHLSQKIQRKTTKKT